MWNGMLDSYTIHDVVIRRYVDRLFPMAYE